ncbi:glycoside hydrolase superfamily, partial [Suillus spraguei]
MLLAQFVFDAHSHGVQAHVAVGGWLGSVWFSSNIATSEKRTTFVKTLTDFVRGYELDGIQFSWEYPGKQGVGCNKISVDDTGINLTVSAAVSLEPFTDVSGKPSADVSGFAQVFDYITLMNYDVWGPSSTHVGPNAPLNDTCASPENRQGSAVSAIKVWTAAGMPINKIVLELLLSPSAAFDSDPDEPGKKTSDEPGKRTPVELGMKTPDEPGTNTSDLSDSKTPDVPGTNAPGEPGGRTLAAYPAFDTSKQPLGDAWDDISSVDVCGILRFWGLMDAGFLNKDGTPADGIDVRYDECSQTPYAYNETSQVMISFDNARSFAAKGKYIKEIGLCGFIIWEVAGDYHDILLDSIREAMGVNTPRMPDITVPAPTPVTSHFIPNPVLHAPNVPKSLPGAPNVPDVPEVPEVPEVPDVPYVPNVPYIPYNPNNPTPLQIP